MVGSIDNGTGSVDFDIDSGLFTAVRALSTISDPRRLLLKLLLTGGLAPILSSESSIRA